MHTIESNAVLSTVIPKVMSRNPYWLQKWPCQAASIARCRAMYMVLNDMKPVYENITYGFVLQRGAGMGRGVALVRFGQRTRGMLAPM